MIEQIFGKFAQKMLQNWFFEIKKADFVENDNEKLQKMGECCRVGVNICKTLHFTLQTRTVIKKYFVTMIPTQRAVQNTLWLLVKTTNKASGA